MTDFKRRSSNALPFKSGSQTPAAHATPSRPRAATPDTRADKVQVERLREKLQKSVIDNPQTAKKAALLISQWIEGKASKLKKTG